MPSRTALLVEVQTWEQELVWSPAWPIFFPRTDDSQCNRIHFSLTTVHCDNGYVGKQPVGRKEYCAECWLKELQENMDRSTGHHDVTEILPKTLLNTLQSINHKIVWNRVLVVICFNPLFLKNFWQLWLHNRRGCSTLFSPFHPIPTQWHL